MSTLNDIDQPHIAPQDVEYAGFWIRFGAQIIDYIITLLVTYPVLYLIFGRVSARINDAGMIDLTDPVLYISLLFAPIWIITFWIVRQATPGKMVVGTYLVCAKTGGAPSTGQCIGRYFAYILSALPLCLGYLWAAWDPKKQAWHDKLAGTYVVRHRG
jgi:uncharacterized RDD family membrane protein YckC